MSEAVKYKVVEASLLPSDFPDTWHEPLVTVVKFDTIDALEADNAALRLAHGKMVAQFDELTSFIGCEFDPQTETWVSGKAPYLSAGTTEVEACKAAVDALRSVAKVLEDKCKQAQSERAALRLKVQGLDRTLADVYAQRDGLQRDLTTLETLVNTVHHELVALFPQPKDPTLDDARAICRNRNAADAQCLYNAYNALLTHRQGMGG